VRGYIYIFMCVCVCIVGDTVSPTDNAVTSHATTTARDAASTTSGKLVHLTRDRPRPPSRRQVARSRTITSLLVGDVVGRAVCDVPEQNGVGYSAHEGTSRTNTSIHTHPHPYTPTHTHPYTHTHTHTHTRTHKHKYPHTHTHTHTSADMEGYKSQSLQTHVHSTHITESFAHTSPNSPNSPNSPTHSNTHTHTHAHTHAHTHVRSVPCFFFAGNLVFGELNLGDTSLCGDRRTTS
jgi:hypothetical protein